MATMRLNVSDIHTFQDSDFPTFYPDVLLVGDTHTWQDDDDATYTFSDGTEYGPAAGILDQLPEFVDNASITAIRAVWRLATRMDVPEAANPFTPRRQFAYHWEHFPHSTSDTEIDVWSNIGDPAFVDLPDTDAIVDLSVTLLPLSFWDESETAFFRSYYGDALKAGTVEASMWPVVSSGATEAGLYVYEHWIEVDYGAGRKRIRGYPVRRSGYPGDKRRRGYPRHP